MPLGEPAIINSIRSLLSDVWQLFARPHNCAAVVDGWFIESRCSRRGLSRHVGDIRLHILEHCGEQPDVAAVTNQLLRVERVQLDAAAEQSAARRLVAGHREVVLHGVLPAGDRVRHGVHAAHAVGRVHAEAAAPLREPHIHARVHELCGYACAHLSN